MRRIAFFPGSFDPITKGHEDIVRRAIPMFDKIIVALGENSSKNEMFPPKQKQNWIEKTFSDCPSVEVINYKGLTIDACKKHQAKFILRGLRNSNDYEYEKNITMMNQAMEPSIETKNSPIGLFNETCSLITSNETLCFFKTSTDFNRSRVLRLHLLREVVTMVSI